MEAMIRLQRPFYRRDARELARDLLGRILVTKIGGERTAGRIIETEAYLGSDDRASHSHRGPTKRNEAMFLEGGHAYVYFIYGMYYCFNVVTGREGAGEAVLIRALEPTEGIETMRRRRGRSPRRDIELTDGPGKLAIALGIGPELNGVDLAADRRIWIEEGEPLAEEEVIITPRIGITKSAELPWRWVRRD
jgi:DNA-3-methyladenine glycosylase